MEFAGHGMADIAANRPVTQDAIFRIASITKTFTAIAVTLGQIVADVTGVPFADYLRERLFLPLGMPDTRGVG
ncbi:serine hydrolase [Nocardia gipuzkoensis]|uniref:serine hydrolase n=1 Tax=Nocardia gipuzkoensis TaxID=2749991 RepID=UPI001E479810|nr:serine hydrolase [Nocardia gipuzkoensis]UGT67828.1 serine hydrolase [Nocardia gipuzkoensis]